MVYTIKSKAYGGQNLELQGTSEGGGGGGAQCAGQPPQKGFWLGMSWVGIESGAVGKEWPRQGGKTKSIATKGQVGANTNRARRGQVKRRAKAGKAYNSEASQEENRMQELFLAFAVGTEARAGGGGGRVVNQNPTALSTRGKRGGGRAQVAIGVAQTPKC